VRVERRIATADSMCDHLAIMRHLPCANRPQRCCDALSPGFGFDNPSLTFTRPSTHIWLCRNDCSKPNKPRFANGVGRMSEGMSKEAVIGRMQKTWQVRRELAQISQPAATATATPSAITPITTIAQGGGHRLVRRGRRVDDHQPKSNQEPHDRQLTASPPAGEGVSTPGGQTRAEATGPERFSTPIEFTKPNVTELGDETHLKGNVNPGRY